MPASPERQLGEKQLVRTFVNIEPDVEYQV